MTLPMLRILPPPWDFRLMTSNSQREAAERFVSDKYESIQRLAMVPVQPPRNPNKPYTSFRINDILNSSACSPDVSPQRRPHRPSSRNPRGVESPPKSADTEHNRLYKLQSQHRHQQNLIRYPHTQKHNGSSKHTNNNNRDIVHRVAPPPPPPPAHLRIVRPWDASPSPGRTSEASSDADDEEITVDDEDGGPPKQRTASLKDVSPLDALMEMANKTFQGLETSEAADAKRREQAALFGKHSAPKKRRKSRTAFTNQQIYELEKRFLYQKYLTPADRDEIAQNLGLSNAQVITWFQNRRAKLKRDLEELKNDVVATKELSTKSGSSDMEFSIDSDIECSSVTDARPPQSSPKGNRSESRSPEPHEHSPVAGEASLCSSRNGGGEECDSPGEIVVDDTDDIHAEQHT